VKIITDNALTAAVAQTVADIEAPPALANPAAHDRHRTARHPCMDNVEPRLSVTAGDIKWPEASTSAFRRRSANCSLSLAGWPA